jgi:6-phosphogluconolactonase (cycloisomerase 2 family)
MALEITVAQISLKSDRLSSETTLEILSSFPRKAMNTKVGYNLVAHSQDTDFALFEVRVWEIWHQQGRAMRKI